MKTLAMATQGEASALLGKDLDLAHAILLRNLIGDGYPGFWMEAPLIGNAGFDFHVSYDRPDLRPGDRFAPGAGFGCQRLVDWFLNEETGGVGLGFAHDLVSRPCERPAVYVNTNHRPLDDDASFFRAAGHPELASAVRGLLQRLPDDYRVWYLGVFANRPGSPARVGCFLPERVRLACAADPESFARELLAIGFDAVRNAMADQLQELARVPLSWEIQFDVFSDGRVGDVLSIDLCLGLEKSIRMGAFFEDEKGLGAQAMRVLGAWGVVDERWALIPRACFARRATSRTSGQAFLLRCWPAFVKAKWSGGVAQPAKVYLSCVARPFRRV
jgi:hypothetical protein